MEGGGHGGGRTKIEIAICQSFCVRLASNFKLKHGRNQRCDKTEFFKFWRPSWILEAILDFLEVAVVQSFWVQFMPNFKLKPGRGQGCDTTEKLKLLAAILDFLEMAIYQSF